MLVMLDSKDLAHISKIAHDMGVDFTKLLRKYKQTVKHNFRNQVVEVAINNKEELKIEEDK